ncbi:MAG: hypothetical protein QOK15_1725 [Nocardioidaceae bacterium]|nr:hypothetical protein [Nocardioidaceae bacterium]
MPHHHHLRSRGLASAAVLLTLAACDVGRPHVADTTSSPSTRPSWSLLGAESDGALLDAGSYGLVAAGQRVKNIAVVRAPAGYRSFGGWTFVAQEGPFRSLGYWTADRVFRDPCSPGAPDKRDGLRDPGPRVDDLASALSAQRWAGTSDPVPTRVDGFDGLYLDYQVPSHLDLARCERRAFDVFTASPEDRHGWFLAAAGERAAIWILDVEGQRVVLSWVAMPGSTAEQRQELSVMARSTNFERPRS